MLNPICRSIILICFCCTSFVVNAQSADGSTVEKILAGTATASAKVDQLNALSKTYFDSNPDSAILIANRSRSLAESINYKPGLALALKNVGMGYYTQSKYADAIKNWQPAQLVFQSIGDKKGVANMLSNQGAVYFAEGDEAKSLELHLQSLKISEEIGDTLRIVTSLNNIGSVYSNKTATYDKSLDYFKRSNLLSLAINDDYLIGTSTVNLGEMYFRMNNDTLALQYFKKSEKAFKGTENLSYTLNNIGRLYTRQKRYKQAIETQQEAVEISRKFDTRLDMTVSLIGLAQAYYASGDVAAAIDAYKQSLDYGLPLHAVSEIRDAYDGLSKAYESQKDFAAAYKYKDLLLAIKDTIYNINTDKKLGTLQFTFDIEKKESEINLLNKDKEIQRQEIKRQRLVRNGFIGGFLVVLLFAGVFLMQRNKITKAKKRGDELLLNILPEETAEELKATGTAKAKSFDLVSVLFTDFKNFTQASELLTPEELVAEINHCYSEFDRIITRHGLEKIKTIGDSYMCAGGLPVTNNTHPFDIVTAALEMVSFIERNKQMHISKNEPYFELRLGVHTGPVVAGIVGIKKFAYDIWGDTVNTASRMESSGAVGKVNISGSTYNIVKDKFICEPRGKLEAKNKGLIEMYFVEGHKLVEG